jgi:capsid portal protein
MIERDGKSKRDTLLQQALDTLSNCYEYMHKVEYDATIDARTMQAIIAIREHLAQPEQEPVAWLYTFDDYSEALMPDEIEQENFTENGYMYTPLYLHPKGE